MGSVFLYSLVRTGLEIKVIKVEVDISNGLPGFNIVGLAGKAVHESKERIKSAIKNTGIRMPRGKITVNLAPANIQKRGSQLDAAIAAGILLCAGEMKRPKAKYIIGELGLDGSLKSGHDLILFGEWAAERKETIIMPSVATERSARPYISVANHIEDILSQTFQKPRIQQESYKPIDEHDHIIGNAHAKRAIEIALTGGHHLCMWGPPGSGKTLLAQYANSLQVVPNNAEWRTIRHIHAAAGKTPEGKRRPFRAPHHSISNAGLLGGGTNPFPGEISLASHGILFLDEFPEFKRSQIESLRQPMESGSIEIHRANYRASFPAKCQIIAAMNPCPCGYFGDQEKSCNCYESDRKRYLQKLSGPIVDRIDMHVYVQRQSAKDLMCTKAMKENIQEIRSHIQRAQDFQSNLQKAEGLEAYKNGIGIEKCALLAAQEATDAAHGSGRFLMRLLRVARSIASLDQSEEIKTPHIHEAFSYKNPELP